MSAAKESAACVGHLPTWCDELIGLLCMKVDAFSVGPPVSPRCPHTVSNQCGCACKSPVTTLRVARGRKPALRSLKPSKPLFIANSRRNDPPVSAAAPCELVYCSGSNLVLSKPAAQVALAKQEYHYVNREGNKWGKNRTTHLSDSFLMKYSEENRSRLKENKTSCLACDASCRTRTGYAGVLLRLALKQS